MHLSHSKVFPIFGFSTALLIPLNSSFLEVPSIPSASLLNSRTNLQVQEWPPTPWEGNYGGGTLVVDLYGDRPDVSKDAALNCINNIMAQFLAGSQAPFVEDEEIYKCKGLVQFVASVFEPFAVTLRDFATAVTILARETEQVGPRNVLVATVGRSPWWCLQSVPGI